MKKPALMIAAAVFGLALALAFLCLAAGALHPLQILWHLAAGFLLFLRQNLPLISTDAGTWTPGLAAFALSIAVIHAFGRSWARRRSRNWRASDSLAIALILPLLFAISFLIPGTLLQLEQLRRDDWTETHRSRRENPPEIPD